MSLSVRWATPDDARPIAAVHIASWRAAYRGLFPDRVLDGLSLDARERDWREWLDDGGARAFTLVAERDRRIVAFCTIEMPARAEDEPGDVAAIPALYAHPDAFGTGVGGALMDAAIDVMRDAGSCEAVLWMLEGNRRAAAFYERQGWRRLRHAAGRLSLDRLQVRRRAAAGGPLPPPADRRYLSEPGAAGVNRGCGFTSWYRHCLYRDGKPGPFRAATGGLTRRRGASGLPPATAAS